MSGQRLVLGVVFALVLLLAPAGTGEEPSTKGLSHEGGFSITIWTGTGPFVANQRISTDQHRATFNDFLHFSLPHDANVYLLDIHPDGQVWLLLDRSLQGRDSNYHFPSDFLDEFWLPASGGTHTFQLFATRTPLNLGQEGTRIANRPRLALDSIRLLIQREGLGESGWAADWVHMKILRISPFSASPNGYLVFRVVEPTDGEEVPVSGAEINVNDSFWEPVYQGKPMLADVGPYSVKARAPEFGPAAEDRCRIRVEDPAGIGDPRWVAPCVVHLDEGEKIHVTFVLHAPDPRRPDFHWRSTRVAGSALGQSYEPCVGESLLFDASATRPPSDVVRYVWNFDEAGLWNPPHTISTADATVQYAFRQAKSHNVELTVEYRDGSRTESKTMTVYAQGERSPACPSTNPVFAVGRARAIEHEDGTHQLVVTNGYASITQHIEPPKEIDPERGGTARFAFRYRFAADLPEKAIREETVQAFSFASVLVDGESVQQCDILQMGDIPDAAAREGFVARDCGLLDIPPKSEETKVIFVSNVVNQRGTENNPLDLVIRDPQLNLPQEFGTKKEETSPEEPSPTMCEDARLELNKRPPFYMPGESITIRFRNDCAFPIQLVRWVVRNADSSRPVLIQQNPLKIQPGGFTEWSWHQRDESGQLVGDCKIFRVELETKNGSPRPRTVVIGSYLKSCFGR